MNTNSREILGDVLILSYFKALILYLIFPIIVLKLMYLKRIWTGIVLGIVIVLNFESFFFALLASVSLGNKNGCKCQHYDYAWD